MRTRPLSLATSLVLAAFAAGAGELTLLNQLQERHVAIKNQVSPAVVEVESLGRNVEANYYGTGVVVSESGLILTSRTAAAEKADSVRVTFANGKIYNAVPVACDPATEICLLKAIQPPNDQKPFAFVELADSEKARVGELACTGGNPFRTISHDGQVSWSVGTVSGIYKLRNADRMTKYAGLVLETDAAVNPGSDGGPLVDSNGRLLGILSNGFCDSRWMGTAVPTHLIKQALAEALKDVKLFPPGSLSRAETAEPVKTTRAIADALIIASQRAEKALVKLIVKRNPPPQTPGQPVALAQRIKQRPDPAAACSGVIFDNRGFILTSAFNVEGEDDGDTPPPITAVLPNGTKLPAKRLGRHFGLDVAVLKIEKPANMELPYIPLEASPELKLGRCVTVLGWSEEGSPTHTSGVVSAVGRLDGSVQTDALINYGNSGGPVVDLRGHLVGIASQVKPGRIWSQINSGVGFFAQSDTIKDSMGDLMFNQDLRAKFKDLGGFDVRQDLQGVKIESIEHGSLAELAKLQLGDVVIVVDGMNTPNPPTLVAVLKAHPPGSPIDILVLRENGRFETRVNLPEAEKK